MKSTYIARQAILDRKSNTVGYELLFRDCLDNAFPEVDPDIATSKIIIQNHFQGNIEAISMGKPAYINFTERCLINKYPLMFNPDSIVIELVGQKRATPKLVKIVKYYHDKGYKVALTEYDLSDQWEVLFPYIAMIKVDVEKINAKRLRPLINKIKPYSIKLAAEKVETRYQLQSLAEVGFNYYQGFFYHEPEIIEGQTLAPHKVQMLHLISETFHTPLNYDSIASIIGRDVNLSIGLLKLVNNVATGTKVEITSLKQATTYLGEEKLRQFVSVLALSKLSSEQTDEISKQSLITAKLMDAIAQLPEFVEVRKLAFITGLLSAIEALLHMPITEVVKTMPLASAIVAALTKHEGLLGELLTLTTQYMLGNRADTLEQFKLYGVSSNFLHEEFVNACQWCRALEI
jgi:EAL and modified HD-GYP domain-containing signal transduction protein